MYQSVLCFLKIKNKRNKCKIDFYLYIYLCIAEFTVVINYISIPNNEYINCCIL